MSDEPTPKRDAFWLYLGLSLSLTWLCWIPALIIAEQQGYTLPTMANRITFGGFVNQQHRLLSTVFNLGAYGPLIAGVIVTTLEQGTSGLVDLLKRTIKWRIAPHWYVKVLLITLAMPVVPFLLASVWGSVHPWETLAATLLPGGLLLLRQLFTSGLGEEPGWRGYMLPRLQHRYPNEKAIWIAGFFWALWHYPLTIQSALLMMNGEAPPIAMLITILVSLAGQTISLMGMSFIYTWLYNHTQSVLLTIVFHALSNTMSSIFAVSDNPMFGIMTAAMPWLVIMVLEKLYGKEQFPGAAPQ